ncbi:AAA family ATPase [Streptomyces sp. SID8379]|uniref:ATP-binding protein n=1 Tax=unclassified Streptomyces TaxID=2593676 RepID=UPI0005BE01E2|nr:MULTISPECIES: helix-turn-helix transcriptional regulator [unclassified Streptomyces]MYW65586.1 AAA family ATPase [Streptomyces sp. SID8379]
MVADRVVSPVCVGRDDALGTLAQAWRTAVERGPAVALVAGEAGIGKSRLLAEFARAAGPGVRVVEGACTEFGGEGLAYTPFVAVLRRLVRGGDVTVESGRYRELARWLPEFGEPGAPGATDTGKHRLYEEVLDLVERVAADRPLVLAVEDLHWADAASRELFAFLARNLTGPGVLLLATYRPGEADAGRLGPLLAELARGPRTVTVRLSRLSRDDVGRQLAAIVGDVPDAATVARVHRRSDGNPLYVEALAHADERTPDSLRDLLLHGPRTLEDPAARRLLGLLSAGGGTVEHRLLVGVAEESGPQLDVLLRTLIDRGLLVTSGDRYDFRHALIRHAVYEDLLPGERARLHARYAEALRQTDAHAELAAHAHAAGDPAQALAAAHRAARRARSSYAYEEQVRMLELVAELWDQVPDAARSVEDDLAGVLTDAAEACMFSGAYQRGVEHATAGLAALDEVREPERAALLLEHRGRLLIRLNTVGTPDFERALRLLPDGPDQVQRGRVLGMLAMGQNPKDPVARRAFDEALRVGRRTGDPTVTVRGLLGAGARHRDLGALAEARTLAERLDSMDLLLTVPMYETTVHLRGGDHRRAVEVALEGARRAHRFGLGLSRGADLTCDAVRGLILAGEWDRAAALVEEALAQGPPPVQDQVLRSLAGQLALLRGDLAAAQAALAATARAPHDVILRHQARWRCLLAVAQGDTERADRLVGEALDDPALAHFYGVESRPVLIAAALVQRARGSAARRSQLDSLDAEFGVDGRLDEAQRTFLHALLGDDDDDGGTGWAASVAAWRDLGQPYELAQSLLYAGRAALAAGDTDGAGPLLKEAAELADGLGAAPLAREIAEAAGPAPAAAVTADRHGLTARELDVLALIAEGWSNRQIAARLHISPSTAGVHVSHILAKLVVETRTQAAAVAHREGLV